MAVVWVDGGCAGGWFGDFDVERSVFLAVDFNGRDGLAPGGYSLSAGLLVDAEREAGSFDGGGFCFGGFSVVVVFVIMVMIVCIAVVILRF